ncbi:MAG: hypothetical protein LBM96_02980 [Methanobrevibacter sp.]|jgi:hypothetical protein|nr:hypothetical protein [Candidatus Methanoflexus mossambicus]
MIKSKKNFFMVLSIFLVSFLFIGIVSAENVTNTKYIDDDSYSSYFDENGTIIDGTINDGDEIIINGTLTNKNLKISKSININGQNTGKIINGTIIFDTQGNPAKVNNLTIENINKNAVEINQYSGYIDFSYNTLRISNDDSYSGMLYGIYSSGWVQDVNITNNIINADFSNVSYGYGIYFTPYLPGYAEGDYNPTNIFISKNKLNLKNTKYLCAVGVDSVIGGVIENNIIDVEAPLVYGVYVGDMWLYAYQNVWDPVESFNISKNTITAKGDMVYLIEFFGMMSSGLVVDSNNLIGQGNGVYGIAMYSTSDSTISNNNLTIIGGNLEDITVSNMDSVPNGNNPITLRANSDNIEIYNNKLTTNIPAFINDTQGTIDRLENNTVEYIVNDNNYYDIFDNNGVLLNLTTGFNMGNTLYLDTLNNKQIIVDRPLNIKGYNSKSKFLYSSISVNEDGSGTIIDGLNIVSNSQVFNIGIDSINNILKNNKIAIVSTDDETAYLSIYVISIYGDNNQIICNKLTFNGNNPSGYYYGISIHSNNNTISENEIAMVSPNYVAGIYLSNVNYNTIDSNKLDLKADNFVYGIVNEYSSWSAGGNTELAIGNKMINNKVNGIGRIVYLIREDLAKNSVISGNELTGTANAIVGIAINGANNDLITNNIIEVLGKDVNDNMTNWDSIGTHQGGIYSKDSSNLIILNNTVSSVYNKNSYNPIELNNNDTVNVIKANNVLNSDYENGLSDGNESGYANGYDEGLVKGNATGYVDGYADGHDEGLVKGTESGYADGYKQGKKDATTPKPANIKAVFKDTKSKNTLKRVYTFKNIGGKTGSKIFKYTISNYILKKINLNTLKVAKSSGVSFSYKSGKLTLKVTNLAKNASKKITFTVKFR